MSYFGSLVKSERSKGILALVFLTLSWASLGFFARYFKTVFLPFQQVYVVIFVSFLAGLIVFQRKIRFSKFRKMPKRELLVVIIRAFSTYFLGAVLFRQAYIYGKYGSVALAVFIAGLLNVVNMFLVNYGFNRVEMVLASNILTLEGIFGSLLGFVLYSELLGFREIVGAILILIGVVKMNKLEEGKI